MTPDPNDPFGEACETVVDDAERPCGHTKGAHQSDGCMWCECGEYR